MKLYLKKLKIIFLFKIFIIILFLISLLSVLKFISSYKLYKGNGHGYGTIINIEVKDKYKVLLIKSKIRYKAYINKSKNINIGDYIYFDYVNVDVENQTIPNTFNYKNYLKSKNIRQLIKIKNYKKIGINKYYTFKGKFIKFVLSKKSRRYILTFLCGDKSLLDVDVKNSYLNNGINHLLSVSGFHIIFILSFIKKLLNKLVKRENTKIFILFLFTLLYLTLSNFTVSLTRASLLYFLVYFNKRYNININNIYLFLFVLFIFLVFKPFLIYDVSFWYSFLISFFLIINKWNFNNIVKTSIYCFLISMPLSIYFNYYINLLSVLFTILFSFIVCYVIYPLSFIALFSNNTDVVLYKLSSLFETLNIRLAKLDFFRIVFGKMNIYILIVIYILILVYILKPKRRYIFLVLFLYILVPLINKIRFDTYIYFLDVKQGDMMLILPKGNDNLTIIDTGGLVNDKYLFSNIKTFLYSLGITKVENLILTHGDYDHMGEAINLVENFKVEKVIFNCGKFNDLEKELIKVLDKKHIKYYSCIKELDIDKNKLYFLQTKEYNNENDNSNVIYTELNGYTFMFMGDASTTTEKEILSKYNLSDIDVLKVGHHGSKTSSGEEFINEINPKYSVISVGKNNRYGHPNKEALDNLSDSKIYRTDQDGSIMFKIKNNKLKFATCAV